MATGADQDLSLGKLRRATDPGNVSSDTTANSKLASDAAGATSDNANYKLSDFSISSVSASLSKSKFHDESTNETVKMEFNDAGSRFIARIAGHNQNFVWKDDKSGTTYNTASSAGYSTVWTAGAISNTITVVAGGQDSMSIAHAGDLRVSMSAAYVDDRVSSGFNDQATNYNKYIIGITQVEDTYNSVAITCFTPETKLTLSDGTEKEIQELSIGDELLSMRMPNARTEEEFPIIASEVAYSEYCITELGETELLPAKIVNMFFDFADSYFVINGDIKVTGEHPFFIKIPKGFYLSTRGQNSEEFWCWEYVRNLEVGQIMYDKDINEVLIDTIEEIEEEIEIVNIDVDGNNTYFAEGVLVHNKGSESRPVANAAHTFEENPGVGGTAI